MKKSWGASRGLGHRLVASTLRCRHCFRAVGDIVGFADRPVEEALFVTLTAPPQHRPLRCARCGGQLYLDEIHPLGRTVPADEVRGTPVAEVLEAGAIAADV